MKEAYSRVKGLIMNAFFSKGRALPILKGPLRGYKYVVKPEVGFASLLGGWEKQSQAVYQGSIFKNFTVFDIGANYGIHSLLYSKLVGEGGRIFAFEPWPENINDIKQNLAINKIQNVTVVEQAISDTKGVAEFKIATHGAEGSLVNIVDNRHQTGRTIKVVTNTLDDFCSSNNIYPDFIKIDIEGAEGYALKGFDNLIPRSYPFFAIDLHTPECDRAAGTFFSKHGYEVYRVNDSSAKALRKWDKPLERVELLDQPWPSPKGIWGVIWCVHPSRKNQVQNFININT
jgi:FkbM family methyltransferase